MKTTNQIMLNNDQVLTDTEAKRLNGGYSDSLVPVRIVFPFPIHPIKFPPIGPLPPVILPYEPIMTL